MPDFIANLIRRKMLFISALVVVAMIGIIAVHGWSWMTATLLIATLIVLPCIWALSAFWIWVFRNSGQQRGRS